MTRLRDRDFDLVFVCTVFENHGLILDSAKMEVKAICVFFVFAARSRFLSVFTRFHSFKPVFAFWLIF